MKTKATWTWLDTMRVAFHLELVARFVRQHHGRRGVRQLTNLWLFEIARLESCR